MMISYKKSLKFLSIILLFIGSITLVLSLSLEVRGTEKFKTPKISEDSIGESSIDNIEKCIKKSGIHKIKIENISQIDNKLYLTSKPSPYTNFVRGFLIGNDSSAKQELINFYKQENIIEDKQRFRNISGYLATSAILIGSAAGIVFSGGTLAPFIGFAAPNLISYVITHNLISFEKSYYHNINSAKFLIKSVKQKSYKVGEKFNSFESLLPSKEDGEWKSKTIEVLGEKYIEKHNNYMEKSGGFEEISVETSGVKEKEFIPVKYKEQIIELNKKLEVLQTVNPKKIDNEYYKIYKDVEEILLKLDELENNIDEGIDGIKGEYTTQVKKIENNINEVEENFEKCDEIIELNEIDSDLKHTVQSGLDDLGYLPEGVTVSSIQGDNNSPSEVMNYSDTEIYDVKDTLKSVKSSLDTGEEGYKDDVYDKIISVKGKSSQIEDKLEKSTNTSVKEVEKSKEFIDEELDGLKDKF
ncbi:MAG: hypothetical protein ACOCP8_04695, partial [archaeon]